MNNDEYYKHFYKMVTDGLAQGLHSPQEWITAYVRCIGLPYDYYPIIHEFCNEAEKDLCSQEYMIPIEDVTDKLIKDWYDHVYKVPKICAFRDVHCDTKNCLDCDPNGKF